MKNLMFSVSVFLMCLLSCFCIQDIHAQQAAKKPKPKCAALSFDGADDYVQVPAAVTNGIGTGDFTFEAWIQAGPGNHTAHPTIFSNRIRTSKWEGMSVFLHNRWGGSTNKMLCIQMDAHNYIDLSTDKVNLLDGKCHHIAIVKNSKDIVYYVDAVQIGTRTVRNNPSIQSSQQPWIGLDPATRGNTAFKGLIEEVRMWNTARTAKQIQNSKQGDCCDKTGLVLYYSMNKLDGQGVGDHSGNKYRGILGSTKKVDKNDPKWIDTCCFVGKCK